MERGAEPSAVRKKLEEARRYARDPEAHATLDRFLAQVRTLEARVAAQKGTGCVIPIAVMALCVIGAAAVRGLLA